MTELEISVAPAFTDVQVARMLGIHPVSVRRWRVKNGRAGCIKYGPPYEYRGYNVVYPVDKFRAWCAQVRVVGGVPRMNLPVTAIQPLPDDPQRAPVTNEET